MPLTYKIILSKQAQLDVDNVYDKICEIATPYNALRTVLRILDKANTLTIFPNRGSFVNEELKIRTVKAGNHRIFFRVNSKLRRVEIVRITTKGIDTERLGF